MEEPLAAQLEWWGNSFLRLRGEVVVTIAESMGELAVFGVLDEQVLADPEAVEMWKLVCGGSPYFQLVFEDGSEFEVALRARGAADGFSLSEFVLETQP